jgi:hypothetical protein
MVFTLNGNVNDFYLAFFFYVTCYIGGTYFFLAGLEMPKNSDTAFDSPVRTERNYYKALVLLHVNQRKAFADWFILLLSFIAFIIGIIAFCYAKTLFEDTTVTTLGATSIIMILMNISAWPIITMDMQSLKRIKNEPLEKKRAHMIIQ